MTNQTKLNLFGLNRADEIRLKAHKYKLHWITIWEKCPYVDAGVWTQLTLEQIYVPQLPLITLKILL